ncbi:MAG: sigma 54-interacting transcriptional regulator [Negativicutes bacterium]|nr:sigma 54-interacting transcriptional regulator [Negativicutes bacterium]
MAKPEMGPNRVLARQLYEILTHVGRISGGFATVTDREGRRLRTVDSHGRELKELRGVTYALAREAAVKQAPLIGRSGLEPEAEAWALPIGDYVLSGSNVERVERDKKLWDSLSQALPLIARVAGGEAVLFDREGCRLESVDPLGRKNEHYIGKVSKAAHQAMLTQQPVIGKSMSVPGATAVRVPITESYGLGFNNEQVVSQRQKLIEEVKKFQYARYNFDDILGQSESIQKVKTVAGYLAQGISSVLIYGETGTGKELFAQAIHNASSRRERPFIAVNCGAIPATLIESNLFGHVEGSFTGAKKGGSQGIFEAANDGTVFFDEISEMEWELQAKLLRVIQEQEVTRIGSTKPIRVNVRIISATNKNLRQMVAEKRFREDLFYRLNVVELKVPPLRERQEDIPSLTKFFIEKFNHTLGKMVVDVSLAVIDIFQKYGWPGNVRELQNCIESSLNLVQPGEQVLERWHLPSQFEAESAGGIPVAAGSAPVAIGVNAPVDLAGLLRETEKGILLRVLKEEQQHRARAARRLGISTTTLWRKLVEHGILQK